MIKQQDNRSRTNAENIAHIVVWIASMTIITACSGLRFHTREQRFMFHDQGAPLATVPTGVDAAQIKLSSHPALLDPAPNRISNTWSEYKINPEAETPTVIS